MPELRPTRLRAPATLASLALVAALAAAGPVGAQTNYELSAFAGVYAPTADGVSRSFTTNATTGSVSTFTIRQHAAPIVGTRYGLLFGPRLGVEAEAAFVPGGATTRVDSVAERSSGHVFMVDVHAVYRHAFAGGRFGAHVLGGFGLLTHGGDAWQGGSENLGRWRASGVGGVGLDYRLQPEGRATLRLDLADRIYRIRGLNETGFTEPLQNDLTLSLGLSWRLHDDD